MIVAQCSVEWVGVLKLRYRGRFLEQNAKYLFLENFSGIYKLHDDLRKVNYNLFSKLHRLRISIQFEACLDLCKN